MTAVLDVIARAFLAVFLIAATLILAALVFLIEMNPVVVGLLIAALIAVDLYLL